MAADLADYSQAVNVVGGSVTISGIATVTISGTPTVQFAPGQSVSISGTPTVIISGTPAVTISSGSVNINGTPLINVVQASGLPMYGPNLLAAGLAGPMQPGGWSSSRTFNATGPVFNADGTMTFTLNGNNQDAFFDAPLPLGAIMPPRAFPGLSYYMEVGLKDLDAQTSVGLALRFMDVSGAEIGGSGIIVSLGTVGASVTRSTTQVAPPNAYYILARGYLSKADGSVGNRIVVDHVFVGQVGALSIAGRVLVGGAVSDNPSTVLVAAAASGQAVITPADPTIFFIGAIVQLASVSGGAGFVGVVKSVNANGTITFTANLTASFVAGDGVIVIPEQLATSRKRAWDWSGVQATVGVAISLLIAGVAGQKLILNHLSFIIINTGAGSATGVSLSVKDQVTGGTVLWASFTGMTATTGDKDRVEMADMAVASMVGRGLLTEMGATIAGSSTSLSVGGYTAITEPV